MPASGDASWRRAGISGELCRLSTFRSRCSVHALNQMKMPSCAEAYIAAAKQRGGEGEFVRRYEKRSWDVSVADIQDGR